MVGRRVEALLAWGLGAACLSYGFWRAWPFTIDDAGIVYAYAEHLASGDGFRAVPGGPVVEGYSDFLWVALLALGAKAGVAPPLAAKVLGGLLLAWTGVAAGILVAQSVPRSIASRSLPAVLMGACPEFVVWAPSGLENSLYAAVLVTALVLDARESEDPALTPFSSLAALAASLTRPEGVLYAGVLGATKLWCAWRERSYRRQCALFFALLSFPLGAYHVWHWVTFRSLVPNTFYAKSPGLRGLETGVDYALEGLVTTGMAFLLPLAVPALLAGARRSAPALAFAGASLAFAVYSRGDWMPHFRFVSIGFPFLAVLSTIGLVAFARLMERLPVRQRVADAALGGLLVAAGVGWTMHQEAKLGDVRHLKWCHFCSRLEDALRHQAASDALELGAVTYLTHDFGGPAYSATSRFMPLDLLGLADQSAALIEREYALGNPRADFARAQYFFHERAEAPTFLYFPDNFWRALGQLPEFQFGYRTLNRSVVVDGRLVPPTRFHLGAFVDFFPPVPAFRFDTVEGRQLIGAAAWRGEKPARIAVNVALQSVYGAQGLAVRLRVRGVEGKIHHLFGGNRSVGSRIGGAGPVSIPVFLTLPADARPEDVVELGVGDGDGEPSFTPLMPLSEVRDAPPPGLRLPFPNNLPGTDDPELLRLHRRLRLLLDRRRAERDHTLVDPGLAEALIAAARRARETNRSSDVYLADVWAMQADPDTTRLLYREVVGLRGVADQNRFLLEHQLLREFYATGDAYWQLQLVAMYAGSSLWDKAEYFLDRLPRFEDPVWRGEAEKLRAMVGERRTKRDASPFGWRPVRGVASDFEDASGEGWSLGQRFRVRSNDGQDVKPVWGIEGRGYLTSEGAAGPARAESAPFVIEGRAIGFVLAGGDQYSLRAELVVGGEIVATARPPKGRSFTPALWNTTELRGKTARLRLVDEAEGALQFLAVDDFRVWPFVEGPRTTD